MRKHLLEQLQDKEKFPWRFWGIFSGET